MVHSVDVNAVDVNAIDVIVVGAGISGIGAAYHLSTECPDRSFTVLEGREQLGGTWDLFRYPGVRSDSDMHTLGYRFKPWVHEKAIADGPSILEYLRDTVEEFDLGQYLNFGHHVERAVWSSSNDTWTLDVRVDGELRHMTCNLLYVCTGYYRYSEGHTPEFPGRDNFTGTIVHPQQWPADLDVTGKRVTVIGSGATAVTIVPELAKNAAHVTMLQRSPTYMAARPDIDTIANKLAEHLPSKLAYSITRAKNIALSQWLYRTTRQSPGLIRRTLLDGVAKQLGPELTEEHFTPTYDPWDQRLCVVPNGDLFDALRAKRASVRTDTIEEFTSTGIALTSGHHLDADIIVTATGLKLVTLGQIDVIVDGKQVDFADTWTYRGIGYSGVPNLISTFGYINASWTLRSEMINSYVCRLLNYMDDIGATSATPTLRPGDKSMAVRPWIDDFSSGYVQRAVTELPRQGDREPWINHQTFLKDRQSLIQTSIDDGVLEFGRRSTLRHGSLAPASDRR